jgi:hypothetical protein
MRRTKPLNLHLTPVWEMVSLATFAKINYLIILLPMKQFGDQKDSMSPPSYQSSPREELMLIEKDINTLKGRIEGFQLTNSSFESKII